VDLPVDHEHHRLIDADHIGAARTTPRFVRCRFRAYHRKNVVPQSDLHLGSDPQSRCGLLPVLPRRGIVGSVCCCLRSRRRERPCRGRERGGHDPRSAPPLPLGVLRRSSGPVHFQPLPRLRRRYTQNRCGLVNCRLFGFRPGHNWSLSILSDARSKNESVGASRQHAAFDPLPLRWPGRAHSLWRILTNPGRLLLRGTPQPARGLTASFSPRATCQNRSMSVIATTRLT
jgi:hypothetical protein